MYDSCSAYERKITGRAPEGRGLPPHKKVREGIRDINFSPLTARKIHRLALGR